LQVEVLSGPVATIGNPVAIGGTVAPAPQTNNVPYSAPQQTNQRPPQQYQPPVQQYQQPQQTNNHGNNTYQKPTQQTSY
jgi:hypothetical protein